jgi:D-alanyl-D-alanine carboxypeptidase
MMRSGSRAENTSLLLRLTACLALFFLTMPLVSCGEGQEPAPSFSEELQQQMQAMVDNVMEQASIPGCIVGVWVPGMGEWVAAIGEADIASGRAMTTEDKVRIASNTKTFTATLVLQLADEGKLGLDDPLEKYVTGVPYGGEITIRQLLNMTAGVFSFSEDEGFLDAFTADPLMEMTPGESLDIALAHPPDFPPGQGWHYSDTNYEILGMIVEQVTGRAIEDEVQARIIEPLGLKNTSFPTTPDMPEGYARGYVLEDDGKLADYTRVSPSVPWAGGAMISNLDDLKIWAKALSSSELLSAEMHEEQLGWVKIPDLENVDGRYGLGIMGLGGFQGHNGAIFGYNSSVLYLPDDDATIVVLVNKSTNSSQESMLVFLGIVQLLFPEQFPNP